MAIITGRTFTAIILAEKRMAEFNSAVFSREIPDNPNAYKMHRETATCAVFCGYLYNQAKNKMQKLNTVEWEHKLDKYYRPGNLQQTERSAISDALVYIAGEVADDPAFVIENMTSETVKQLLGRSMEAQILTNRVGAKMFGLSHGKEYEGKAERLDSRIAESYRLLYLFIKECIT